jgi:sugar phosphate isomerase/epimerase
MRNYKFGISSADEAPNNAPIPLKGGICEIIKEAASLGYDAIEIHIRESDDIDYETVKKCCDEYNIKISAVVTGRLYTEGKCNLMDSIPYINEAAIKGIKTYIDIASNLNTNIVIGWVKGNVPSGKNRVKYMNRLAKNLKILSEYAVHMDVKLFIEVINRYEVNVFNTAKETKEFLEKHNIQNCYIHLDTFHMNIDETDPVEAILTCEKKLGYIHFADNTRCYPGSGQIDFKRIIKALNDIGYNGYLTVECLPSPDGKTAAAKALRYLKSLL